MAPLPGPALDLLTVGVSPAELRRDGVGAVIRSLRAVMLSAHRAGVGFTDLHPLLVDVEHRRLAEQLVIRRDGKRRSRAGLERLLHKHWQDTAAVTASGPVWDPDHAAAVIAWYRARLATSNGLCGQDRAVMVVALDLAESWATTRPALPGRMVAKMAGISEWAARVSLDRLCAAGWLRLAKRGNARTGRANLFALPAPEPGLGLTHMGGSTHLCVTPHMRDPHMREDGTP